MTRILLFFGLLTFSSQREMAIDFIEFSLNETVDSIPLGTAQIASEQARAVISMAFALQLISVVEANDFLSELPDLSTTHERG